MAKDIIYTGSYNKWTTDTVADAIIRRISFCLLRDLNQNLTLTTNENKFQTLKEKEV